VRSILKSFGIVSLATLVSRVFGLIRDIVSASLFGTTLVWDAFLISFMIPNLFRRLLGEGALSSSFIPVFADTLKEKGKRGAWDLVNHVFSGLIVTTSLLVLGGAFFLWIGETAFGVEGKGALVLSLMRVLLPYLILINLTALLIAALNSLGVFGIPASSPILLNAVWIGAILILCPRAGGPLSEQVYTLAFCLLGAGLLQLGLQFWTLIRRGWRFRFALNFKHPGVRRMLMLMGPAAAGLMLHQLNVTVDLALGYSLGDGAVSSLWYGSRLMQFPLGLFAIAMGTVVLPTFSGQTAAQDMGRMKETLSLSLRTILIIMIPASIGLMVLRTPIIQLLFERNQFDAVSTSRAATTLFYYCLGLFAYSSAKILVPCFYSLKDTRTPVRIVAVAVCANFILNLILMRWLKEGGLALATSIAGILELGLLVFFLRRKIGMVDGPRILATILKVLVAGLLMGLVATGVLQWVLGSWGGEALSLKMAAVFFPLIAGVISFVGLAWLFRLQELRDLLTGLRKRVAARKKHA